jgi:hypothetical protein
MPGEAKAFFSYSRQDSEFALRLAKDLRDRGAAVWIDQLDIEPGTHWDESVEKAVGECSILLLVLSPNSTQSENVMDEVSYALDEKKVIIPVMFAACKLPLRLRRTQYVDIRSNYESGLQEILKTLHVVQQTGAVHDEVPADAPSAAAEQAERQRAQAEATAKAQQQAQQEAQQRAAREQAERQAQLQREQLQREQLINAARQQKPPLSAVRPAGEPKSRKPLWITLGVLGAFLLIGGIISAINDSAKANQSVPRPSIGSGTPAAETSAPAPVVPAQQQETTSSAANQQALLNWLNGFIQASQGPPVNNILQYYSATVTPYFSFPVAQWAQIAADKQAYFNRFPQVQYQLVSWQHIPRQDGTEEVDYSVRYTAVRHDGVIARGVSNVGMIVRQEDGQWKIVAIRERTQP